MSQKGISLDNTILERFLEKLFHNNSTHPQNGYHSNYTKYYELATFIEAEIVRSFGARQKKPGIAPLFTVLNNLIECHNLCV